MNLLRFAVAASVMLLASSCHQKNKKIITEMALLENAPPPRIDRSSETVSNTDGKEEQRQSKKFEWDKKIVKHGTLNIEVDDYKKFNAFVHELITKWEAYVAAEQENSSDYKIENVLTIKVPVQFFDDAIQQLASQKEKLLTRQINSEDVTAEFLDTRARMEAKKKVRLRYLDMLKQAKNMEEILQVEKEVNAIQEQIEAGEGRVNYLSHAAAYSTIQLTFFQVLNAGVAYNENPGFGKRILLAFSGGLHWIAELMIILVTLWPLWLGVATGIFVIRKMIITARVSRSANTVK
jgi:hypothetical protein